MRNREQHPSEIANQPDFLKRISADASNPSEGLSDDKDFLKLRQAYQNANFSACDELIKQLEERYPNQSLLRKYREEIQIRNTVKSIERRKKNSEKRKKKTRSLRLSLFAIASTLLVMAAFVISYFYFNNKVAAKQIQEESTQLARLAEQVDQLLLVGKPRSAAEVLEQMRTINPGYDRLSELESQTYNLLLHELKYQTAISLLEEGKDQEALQLFKEIETDWPGLWDVRQQINALEGQTQSKPRFHDVGKITQNQSCELLARQKPELSLIWLGLYPNNHHFLNIHSAESILMNASDRQKRPGEGVHWQKT